MCHYLLILTISHEDVDFAKLGSVLSGAPTNTLQSLTYLRSARHNHQSINSGQVITLIQLLAGDEDIELARTKSIQVNLLLGIGHFVIDIVVIKATIDESMGQK